MLKRTLLLLAVAAGETAAEPPAPADAGVGARRAAAFFRPPPELAGDLRPYRPVLQFPDGRPVKDGADWAKRRREILKTWHDILGPWPPLLERPKLEYLGKERRENFTQHAIRIEVAPGRTTADAYL